MKECFRPVLQLTIIKSALGPNLYPWPERAPSRQSGIGGVEGHNMKEISSPGSPALWAGSFTLPIFHKSFLLTLDFFLKTKKYLRRHPVDSCLEYIYFMKIGQPKLTVLEDVAENFHFSQMYPG